MHRLMAALAVWSFAARVAVCADDTDPVAKKLDAAKAIYAKDQERQRAGVLELFDQREAVSRRSGDKEALDRLKLDRAAYDQRTELPAWLPLEQIALMVSRREAMTAAYDAAIREYTRQKQDDRAAYLAAQRKAFDASAPLLMGFDHEVRSLKGKLVRRFRINLYADLTLERADQQGATQPPDALKSKWSLSRDALSLNWADPKVPGGYTIDTVRLSRDGQTYAGVNQQRRIKLSGTRVSVAKASP